jgi:hypothetical protein
VCCACSCASRTLRIGRRGYEGTALAPAGKALRTAVAVRVGADVADLVVLGTTLPDPTARAKAAGVAAAWGTLCGLSYLAAGH